MFFLSAVISVLAVLGNASPMKRQNANVIYSCTQPNMVALTFDDGPYIWGSEVSDILTQHNATGTFFYNGNNWDCIYDSNIIATVQHVYNAGHMIASHTWSHPDLTTLTWDQIHNEMWLIEQAILRITGAYPAFFRPPYGSFNDLVLQAAYVRGQQVVIWDFDSGDSVGASEQQQMANYDSTIASHPSNILALNHETYDSTVHQTLPYAIQQLQAAGYQLVSLDVCLGGEQRYQYVTAPQQFDPSTWHC